MCGGDERGDPIIGADVRDWLSKVCEGVRKLTIGLHKERVGEGCSGTVGLNVRDCPHGTRAIGTKVELLTVGTFFFGTLPGRHLARLENII